MSLRRHIRYRRRILVGCVIFFSTALPAVGQDYEAIGIRSGITVAGEWPRFDHSGPHSLLAPGLSQQTRASLVSLKSGRAPREARRTYGQGLQVLSGRKPDLEHAIGHFEQAVQIYPAYAAAWTTLGRARRQRGDSGGARSALLRSIKIDPSFLIPYQQLAHIAVAAGRWSEALLLAEKMIALNPLFPMGHYYKGAALLKLKGPATAREAVLEAQSTPDAGLYPVTHYLMGEIYRTERDYSSAAHEYRLYLASGPADGWGAKACDRLEEWKRLGLIQPQVKNSKRKRK